MRVSVSLALMLGALGLGLGCTVHTPPPSPPDSGTDAHRDDANLARDTGLIDASMIDAAMDDAAMGDAAMGDAGSDGGSDAGHDAGADAGHDGGGDGGSDASSDGGSDAGPDAATGLPGVLNETNLPAEADYCVIQFPTTVTMAAGVASAEIYGRIYEAGLTDVTTGGPAPGILAELGYGPAGTDPRTSTAWSFHAATFNVETGIGNNDDEYMSTLTIAGAGTYAYAYRFSFDGGANVTYCDLDGAGSSSGFDFSPTQLGTATVM